MKRLLLTAGLISLLQACGGNGGGLKADGSVEEITGVGQLNGLRIDGLIQSLRMDASDQDDILNTQGDIFDLAGQPFMAPDYSTCISFKTGSSKNDKDFKIVYDCQDIPDTNSLNTKVGFLEKKSVDKNDLSKGYRYDYDILNRRDSDGGIFNEDQYIGFQELKKSSSQIQYESERKWSIKGNYYAMTSRPNIKLDWYWIDQSKRTYTPDDMDNPFSSGKISFSGFYKVAGMMGANAVGGQYSSAFTFEFSSQNLEYDSAACGGNYFKSGSILFKDGSKNELKYTYDCGNPLMVKKLTNKRGPAKQRAFFLITINSF
jgi:hypothetical protein